MTDGFMLMYKDLPNLQVVVHSIRSFPLLRSLSTLCQQHLRFMQENRPLQPREHTLLTFSPAKRSSENPSPQSTPTKPTSTSTPITEQSVVPAELPLPPPLVRKCYHLKSKMQTIYAGHIHNYATDMRRPMHAGNWRCA